jgi:hypothetical protein
MNGGHTWNLHHWNYPWHELTIGAVGNSLMFLVGCTASVVLPADQASGPTLWDWLAMDRRLKREQTLGDAHESIAQSS